MKHLIITILAAVALAGCASTETPVAHNKIQDARLSCADIEIEYEKMQKIVQGGQNSSSYAYIPFVGGSISSSKYYASKAANDRAEDLMRDFKKKGCDKQPK
jgi:hypothetical protein